MRSTESPADPCSAFNRAEVAALKLAADSGWLTLTPEIGDRALAEWREACERSGRAFAVVRLEPKRASLWFLLTTGREWTQAEQARILGALSSTTCYVLSSNNVRAFAQLGTEDDLMQQLLAADAGLH